MKSLNSSKLPVAIALGSLLLCAAVTSDAASARPAKTTAITGEARPIAGDDTRLVVFNYDAELTYPILSRDSLYTNIEIRPGEIVQGFYLSDTTRWKHHVAGNRARIMIKPTAPDLFTSATLVTNKRTYELTFRSGGMNSPWYQRVRWSVSDDDAIPASQATGVYEDAAGGVVEYRDPVGSKPTPPFSGSNQGMAPSPFAAMGDAAGTLDRSPSTRVRPDKLDFGYTIDGSATFKPQMVFDDGKFTWFQLASSQDLPALFRVGKDGAEVLDYTVQGSYLMVSSLADEFLLKLGESEVRVRRKCEGFFFSSGCKR